MQCDVAELWIYPNLSSIAFLVREALVPLFLKLKGAIKYNLITEVKSIILLSRDLYGAGTQGCAESVEAS